MIKSFKMLDGTEVIAEILRTSLSEGWLVRRPLMIVPMQDGRGGVRIDFALWSMIANIDEEFMIYRHAVQRDPLSIDAEVEKSYLTNFSGLVIAPSADPFLKG